MFPIPLAYSNLPAITYSRVCKIFVREKEGAPNKEPSEKSQRNMILTLAMDPVSAKREKDRLWVYGNYLCVVEITLGQEQFLGGEHYIMRRGMPICSNKLFSVADLGITSI